MNPNPDKYFSDYENLEVHELMLKDRPRQKAYYHAILNNTALFKDKVVMDVGAGTGILSAFCAKAGAKLVYAVEASNLAKIALKVIEENELTRIVKVVNRKVEEFILPDLADKIDIIVSEWMGFYLMHEGMLDSVIYARDAFLKPNGCMFPREATIFVAPCSVPSRFDYWNNIDGVQMTKFAAMLRAQKSTKPEIAQIRAEDLMHEGVVLHWMNLEEVTRQELDEITFKSVVAVQKAGKHQGFCIWFECRFPSDSYEDAVVLSTSPCEPETHWKQCIIVLPDTACEDVEIGTPIAFNISMKRNCNDQRKYDLELELLNTNKEEHPIPCDCFMTKCILTKAHLLAVDKAK